VNEAASDRLTPLVVATIRDHAPFAIFLLAHGADPNADAAGYTALHWAAGVWETELTGPRGIATERDEEWSALRGVRTGKHSLVAALLAHGADPDVRIAKAPQRVGFTRGGLNLIGATPFLVAAAAGDAALMRLLAANGANALLATAEHTTPVMAAAGVGRVAAESRVTESSALEALQLAIELGGDIRAVNDAGDTALHGAASMRWNLLVQYLVDRGAAVDVKNKRGRTPAMNAAGSSTADLLRSAVERPADSIR
jgi:ankyrin repeat protein